MDKEKITGDEFRQIIKEVNSPVEDVFDTTEVSENTSENIEE